MNLHFAPCDRFVLIDRSLWMKLSFRRSVATEESLNNICSLYKRIFTSLPAIAAFWLTGHYEWKCHSEGAKRLKNLLIIFVLYIKESSLRSLRSLRSDWQDVMNESVIHKEQSDWPCPQLVGEESFVIINLSCIKRFFLPAVVWMTGRCEWICHSEGA